MFVFFSSMTIDIILIKQVFHFFGKVTYCLLMVVKLEFHILIFQFVKCGYAGTNFPEHIFPSMVGRPMLRSSAKVGDIEIKVSFKHINSLYFCIFFIICTSYYTVPRTIWQIFFEFLIFSLFI